ncbi:GNAT family N-acetyltransferase [Oceanobacillus sp. CAU 1775]
MKIRKPTINDAKAIAKVHVDSWRTTYKGIIPQSFLDNLSYEQREKLWQKNLADKEQYILVAENTEGQIIGFGTAAKRQENKIENSSDLTSIYLLEEYQGKGIGRQLLAELFRHFVHLGCEKVFVEVLDDNKTKHFYEYYGATLVEEVQIKIGGEVLNELIYVWDDVAGTYNKLKNRK